MKGVKVHLSPALNGSSEISCFQRGDVIKIRDIIMFTFYLGLSHGKVTAIISAVKITEVCPYLLEFSTMQKSLAASRD